MNGAEADWTTTTIGQCASFLTGYPFPSSRYSVSGARLVRGSNVKRSVLDWSPDITKRWPAEDPMLAAFRLRTGDIVVAMDGALVGRSYARISDADLPAYLVQRVARLRGTSVDQRLLYQWVGSDRFVAHVDSVKTHTAIPHISPRDIRDFQIPVPASVEEQRLISEALSDVDALVGCIEGLLAKKKAIRQGVIQELFSGRTRLPGFSTDWTNTHLGSVGALLKGRGIRRDDVRPAGVPCIRYGELYTSFDDYTTDTRSFVTPEVASTALPLRSGDVLFAGSGETREEIGKCVAYVGDSPAVAGGDVIVLRTEICNPIYLAVLANTPDVVAQKARAGQGDAVVHIYGQSLAAVRVFLPSREEQDAIARVIIDIDEQLRSLQGRLIKARSMKMGMMQELLTGRTRLYAAEDVA